MIANKKQNHKDTTLSLHPLSFEEAIKELAQSSKHKDSQVEESDNTKEPDPETGSSKKRTAPQRKYSAD